MSVRFLFSIVVSEEFLEEQPQRVARLAGNLVLPLPKETGVIPRLVQDLEEKRSFRRKEVIEATFIHAGNRADLGDTD